MLESTPINPSPFSKIEPIQQSTSVSPNTPKNRVSQAALKALGFVCEGSKALSNITGISDIVTGVRQPSLHQFAKGMGKAFLSTLVIGTMIIGVTKYQAQNQARLEQTEYRFHLRQGYADYAALSKICGDNLDCITTELNNAIEYKAQHNFTPTLQTAEQLKSTITQDLLKGSMCYDSYFGYSHHVKAYSIVTGMNSVETHKKLFDYVEAIKTNDNTFMQRPIEKMTFDLQPYPPPEVDKYCTKFIDRAMYLRFAEGDKFFNKPSAS